MLDKFLLGLCQGKQTLQLSDRCNHYVDKDGTDANELLPQMNGTDGGWINEMDQRQKDDRQYSTQYPYASLLFSLNQLEW